MANNSTIRRKKWAVLAKRRKNSIIESFFYIISQEAVRMGGFLPLVV